MRFSINDKLILFKLLSDLNKDGMPIFDSLNVVIGHGEGVYNKKFVNKVSSVVENLKSSSSLAEALAPYISQEEMAVISAAEKAGRLSDGFSSLVDQTLIRKQIFSSLFSVLVIPIVLFAACFAVIMMYAIKVFPAFEMALPLSKWPSLSAFVYQTGLWLIHGGALYIILSISIIVALTSYSLSRVTGSFRDRFLDRIQPYKTYKKLSSSSFLTSLSLLVKSGVPVVDAIKLLHEYSHGWLKSCIGKMIDKLNRGADYKESFNIGFFMPEDLFLIVVYATSGEFHDVLSKLSAKSNENTLLSIKRLGSLLNFIALIFFAGIVLAIFGSTFSLSSKFADL